MAQFTAKLGQTVNIIIDGHSALNGAKIPEGSRVEIGNNDPTVATIPATIAVGAGGSEQLKAPVTLLAPGVTDAPVKITTPDGSVFEGAATLMVEPAPEPGLVRIEVSFEVI